MPTTWIEQFDPATNEWTRLIEATRGRTYHNSAVLLPDGPVMLGGHAPISTLYGNNTTLPAASPTSRAVTRRSRSTSRRTCTAGTVP